MELVGAVEEPQAVEHFSSSAFSKVHLDLAPGRELDPQKSDFCLWNPWQAPGEWIFCYAACIRDSISSQVATKLSLQHFCEGVSEEAFKGNCPTARAALERGFDRANDSVYSFGHSLAAGGKLSAALFSFCVRGGKVAAGRVGQFQAYLLRDGELLGLFEEFVDRGQDGMVGSRSQVAVELASVSLEPEDRFFLSSQTLSRELEERLTELSQDVGFFEQEKPATELAGFLFENPRSVAFTMTVQVASPSLFLPSASRIRL